eukprot:scaffold20762_cov20-Tisochrysis_lutea.AAC.3
MRALCVLSLSVEVVNAREVGVHVLSKPQQSTGLTELCAGWCVIAVLGTRLLPLHPCHPLPWILLAAQPSLQAAIDGR